MNNSTNRNGEMWKGLIAGVAGGLVASWTMNQFQAVWGELMEGVVRPHGAQSLQEGSPDHGVARELQERGSNEKDDNAAVRAGTAVGELVLNRKLTKQEKNLAGAIAHYAMGVVSGGVYGATAEAVPEATAGAGIPYGAAVWLVADEGLAPLLGLSKGPTEYPLSIHTYALASHLVFGVSTEAVRRTVRNALH